MCEHPQCTGVHSHRHPYAQWCPAAKDLHADAQANYKRTAKGMLTDARYNAQGRGNK